MVNLGPEVVDTLIARGEQADRLSVHHYATALARARVPQTTNFFQTILRDDTGKHHMPSAKFYAAVGLAQLGEHSGYEWLIENSGDTLPIVEDAWPRGVANNNMDSCCQAALRHLTGKSDIKSKTDWQIWWQQVGKAAPLTGRVYIVDDR
jgi:hypothetical protein